MRLKVDGNGASRRQVDARDNALESSELSEEERSLPPPVPTADTHSRLSLLL
jgi:hypothetical protein